MTLPLALGAALLASGLEKPPAVFRSEARLVVLHATVRDTRGEAVTNLGQEAFRVYENGKSQPITLFSREDIPVSLGLLLDNSGSMRKLRASVEASALACVRASNPEDEVFVLNFADKARVDVPLTRDLHLLESGIARLDSIGGTALRDALEMGTRYVTEHGRRDRKVLLLVSDGFDNASVSSLEQIRDLSERSEVAVYAVGLLYEEGDSKAARARKDLGQLAEWTGGSTYYPQAAEDLSDLALEIARQIRNQYTIGYTPSDQSLDGSYRKLRVEARGREKLAVQTRAGYRAVPLGAR